MNPMEWLKALYAAFGARHPISSTIVVMMIFGAAGFVLWTVAGHLYHQDPLPPVSAAVLPAATPSLPAATEHTKKQTHTPAKRAETRDQAKAKQRTSHIGNDNTLVNAPVPAEIGSGNTIVGPNEPGGNVIYNKGGTAIGKGACAGPGDVAIGAGANGNCEHKAAQPHPSQPHN